MMCHGLKDILFQCIDLSFLETYPGDVTSSPLVILSMKWWIIYDSQFRRIGLRLGQTNADATWDSPPPSPPQQQWRSQTWGRSRLNSVGCRWLLPAQIMVPPISNQCHWNFRLSLVGGGALMHIKYDYFWCQLPYHFKRSSQQHKSNLKHWNHFSSFISKFKLIFKLECTWPQK